MNCDTRAMIDAPSPNHDARPAGTHIDALVLHYTGMATAAEALARMRDPAAKVSAHYMVGEDGSVHRLVAEARRAWHAGPSAWGGRDNVNDFSIGVELVNPGHDFGYRPFPEAQMTALIDLARDIVARHAIAARRVLGHSDVAPARKTDPGELFDWPRLAAAGIGLWPDAATAEAGDPTLAEVQRALAAYGYGVRTDGGADEFTRRTIAAFQRHFRPRRIDGNADAETLGRLHALLRRLD